MNRYLFFRTIHIFSSNILFGTGIWTAFFMWWANQNGNTTEKSFIAKTTVIADFQFTLPGVIIQPLTGIILITNGKL